MAPADSSLVAKPQLSSTGPAVASSVQSEAGRDPAKLSEFESEVIGIFVDMMQTLGMPKSYGEIYGLLYATAEPLGFGEIHERLTLSKGSVSGGVKALKEIGAVKVAAMAEERRERYEPEIELRKLVLAYLEERIQPQLQANATRMARLEILLEGSDKADEARSTKTLQARLGKLSSWRKKASGIIPWVARFLG